MHKLRTYIISLFLLGVFLTPLVVNVFHHHEHVFICSAKNEKHYHTYHEKCPICSFHFSIYTSEKNLIQSVIKVFYCKVNYSYFSTKYLTSDSFSYLLRGPPVCKSRYMLQIGLNQQYIV